ncbi:lipoprotein BA_5634 family protein [Clostridium sp. Marseille-QA1073]
MKRFIKLLSISLLSMSLLTGCSLTDKILSKANGVALYGSQQQIENTIEKYKEELKSETSYEIKVAEIDDKKLMVLNKTTAEAFIKRGIFKKVDKNDNTETLKSLPTVTSDTGILFAKNNVENLMINDKKLNVKHEGNIIIGDGRVYVDMFAIVDDSIWKTIDREEKTIGLLEFNKDPKHEMINFDVELAQLMKFE